MLDAVVAALAAHVWYLLRVFARMQVPRAGNVLVGGLCNFDSVVCCCIPACVFSDTGGSALDVEVGSKFADRPMLKALHLKFPGGAPAPPDPQYTSLHLHMADTMHDRRVMEDPNLHTA